MNKTTSFHRWHILLANLLGLLLAGCDTMTPTIATTLQSPTSVAPYIHYSPSEEFNTQLEFYYPGSWLFSEEKIKDTDIIVVGFGDPRFLSVPTRAPNEAHGTPSDFGSVTIWIEPVNSDHTLDTLLQAYKQGHSGVSWIKALNNYQITIDGYNARVFEYQIEPFDENGYISTMFERDIFFAIHDHIYHITFRVAEKERRGEFEKGYDYFFNSIEIVP